MQKMGMRKCNYIVNLKSYSLIELFSPYQQVLMLLGHIDSKVPMYHAKHPPTRKII
jgi:hypothetical protein